MFTCYMYSCVLQHTITAVVCTHTYTKIISLHVIYYIFKIDFLTLHTWYTHVYVHHIHDIHDTCMCATCTHIHDILHVPPAITVCAHLRRHRRYPYIKKRYQVPTYVYFKGTFEVHVPSNIMKVLCIYQIQYAYQYFTDYRFYSVGCTPDS